LNQKYELNIKYAFIYPLFLEKYPVENICYPFYGYPRFKINPKKLFIVELKRLQKEVSVEDSTYCKVV
jgi:hypothetical protein